MTAHSIAVCIVALWLVQFGIALGLPKDTRPWTPLRRMSLLVGSGCFVFTIWLVATVI